MRKRRTQGQQATASGVSLWAFLYAFQSPFQRDWSNPIIAPLIACQKPATAAYSPA